MTKSKLSPPITTHLFSRGAARATLDELPARAAIHQENEMDSLLAMMLNVLQPALIVLMGLMVLAIVMAILLPIFQLNQLAG